MLLQCVAVFTVEYASSELARVAYGSGQLTGRVQSGRVGRVVSNRVTVFTKVGSDPVISNIVYFGETVWLITAGRFGPEYLFNDGSDRVGSDPASCGSGLVRKNGPVRNSRLPCIITLLLCKFISNYKQRYKTIT